MRKTPWSQQTSTLPSDRLAPKRTPTPSKQQQGQKSGKNKSGGDDAEPKSREVRKLEQVLKNVRNEGNSKRVDPKGGCFCQARTHSLSSYTPICLTCGLPLCSINLPGYACPSCLASLIASPSDRTILVLRLEDELEQQKQKEERERDRKLEEARQAAGAFPTLPGASSKGSPSSTPGTRTPVQAPIPQQYKVLSLGAKGKRPVLTTTTKRPTSTPGSASGSPAGSRPSSPPVTRIPPPVDMDKVHPENGKLDPARPWRNLRDAREGREAVYVPDKEVPETKTSEGGGEGKSSRRKRGKGKEKEKENIP